MKVTVLLVVYNGARHLSECIESVLAQTYSSFEFLVVDDGSTDMTVDIVRGYNDSRIRLIMNHHDYIGSLNTGISLANGEYIARIDADDIMFPNRLAEQVVVMEKYSQVDVCGTWAVTFGRAFYSMSSFNGFVENPLSKLLLGNFMIHPTVMLRKEFLVRNHLQYKKYAYAEDFKLWTDIAIKNGTFYIIPEQLLKYRLSSEQVSCKHAKKQCDTGRRVQDEILIYILNDERVQELDVFQNIYISLEKLNVERRISRLVIIQVIAILYSELLERQGESANNGSLINK